MAICETATTEMTMNFIFNMLAFQFRVFEPKNNFLLSLMSLKYSIHLINSAMSEHYFFLSTEYSVTNKPSPMLIAGCNSLLLWSGSPKLPYLLDQECYF